MIGALGTLGVITRVNFKTFPMPLATRGFVARFANAETALDMRHRIARSLLTPLTMEILSPGVAELFSSDAATRYERAAMPANVISNTEWALTAGYAGDEPVLERYAKDLQRMAQESGATGVAILAESLPPAWARKREVIPIALASSPATTIIKIGVLPMRMNEALATAEKAAEANNLRWAAMARGLGIIYFAILPSDHTEDWRQRVASAIVAIQEVCAKLAGHATIPWVPAEWKSTLQIWGAPRPDAPKMQKVKSVFDPQNILSPGRFAQNL
jgi:glycolate oxidase FAD binding subunit